ncbi:MULTISPECIES: hypothetical protein [Streptomyces]|uniref:Uncharacterized protein n=1 Tax=Streptomyces venezuelae TaxID=54571 RepID=A0A5P2AL25_STRVZ|nr:hypothetical protein [Streptomyces venezuelae]QES18716.1 hypothetical protein DEJ46_06140 [Streptomyces venezuelae]
MAHSYPLGPSDEELWALTRYLLASGGQLDDLKRRGTAPERLQDAVRTGGALHQTSLHAAGLLAKAALSDATTTVDGLVAVSLLRRLAEATASAALRAADSIAALAHGDTTTADHLLEQARVHLHRTPVTCQEVGSALLRHDGYLYAQARAARENLGPSAGTVKVSEAQRKGLASLARGDGVFREARHSVRELESPLNASVRTATIDALAAKELLTLTPLTGKQCRSAIRLTSAGIQALLAASPPKPGGRPAIATSVPNRPRPAARTSARR